jgi:hypothetical protein
LRSAQRAFCGAGFLDYRRMIAKDWNLADLGGHEVKGEPLLSRM